MRQYTLQTRLCCGAGRVVVDHHAGRNFCVDPLLLGLHLLQGIKVLAGWLVEFLFKLRQCGWFKSLSVHVRKNLSGPFEVATPLMGDKQTNTQISGHGQG